MEQVLEAAEKAQDILDKNAATDPKIKKMMDIVHRFVQTEKVMCYGGTAINNILPPKKQFYHPEVDVPDYDFFCLNPQKLCVKLSDQLKKAGLENIEAKPGMHLGTFKVFCDYVGVADISSIDPELFQRLWKDSIIKDKIRYVPADFLRMNMYLELSRPMGDVSRWKKVYTRLQLLNSEYPVDCPKDKVYSDTKLNSSMKSKVESLLIKDKVVLLGFNGTLYHEDRQQWNLPMDLLVEEKHVSDLIRNLIQLFGKGVAKARSYEEYAELLPAHTDIVEGTTLLARVYETMACHSYHELRSGLMIASIPTLLNFFFAMLYADKEFAEHTTRQRIICTAERLVKMANEGKRFKLLTPITCLGKQKELIDMKKERAELYEKASKNRQGQLFKKYFFSYKP
jgi:hypothetical protein